MNQPYSLNYLTTPLTGKVAGELIVWWQTIFQTDFAWLTAPLTGKEDHYSQSYVYLFTCSDQIIATCRVAHSRTDTRLACLGEVATSQEFRGQGLARILCQKAVDDFGRRNGQALFLATADPSPARKLYTSLGWQPIAGSNAMVRLSSPLSVEQFLHDYFHTTQDGPITIVPGGPQHRIAMIPLILSPHDWIVLDHNTAIISTRHAVQPSCEGLYGRYDALNADPSAAWFAAVRPDHAAVGLASAKPVASDTFCIDAFTHPYYEHSCLNALYSQAIDWARHHRAQTLYTTCARNDHFKKAALHQYQIDKLLDITFINR